MLLSRTTAANQCGVYDQHVCWDPPLCIDHPQTCILPFKYKNNTYADCLVENGTELCMVPGGQMMVGVT
jgi:hypothetical protein